MSDYLEQYNDVDFTGKTLVIKRLKDEIKELENEAHDIKTDKPNRTRLLTKAKEKRELLEMLVEDTTALRGNTANRKQNKFIERAIKLTVGSRFD